MKLKTRSWKQKGRFKHPLLRRPPRETRRALGDSPCAEVGAQRRRVGGRGGEQRALPRDGGAASPGKPVTRAGADRRNMRF